jgi:hypothetical protein
MGHRPVQETARTCGCAHGMQFMCRLNGPRGRDTPHDQTPALRAEKNGTSSPEERGSSNKDKAGAARMTRRERVQTLEKKDP